jgi:hypothetical protein
MGMTNTNFRAYDKELRSLSQMPSSFFERVIDRFLNRFLSVNHYKYSFKIPSSTYLRAEMLCEDISDEAELAFELSDLIGILTEDFLRSIRRNPNPEYVYKGLVTRDRRKPIVINHSDTDFENERFGTCQTVQLHVQLKKRQALKLEIFLSDLYEVYNQAPFYVEDVLEILLCDFIYCYKNGLINNAFDEIMKYLGQD